MFAAGHPSPFLGEPEVGKNEEVRKFLTELLSLRATWVMENCEDLFGAVDTLITKDESIFC